MSRCRRAGTSGLTSAHLEGLPPPDVAAVEGALVGHLALGAVQGLMLGRLLAPRRRRV